MNSGTEQNSTDLLACFFSECESAFRFLEIKYGYSYLSGMVNYQKGRHIIKPYRGQFVTNKFQATTRYEVENKAIEILYSDESFMIESYIYIDQIHRISFSDILQAAKKDNESVQNNIWVTKQSQIENIVNDISSVLKNNQHVFLSTDMSIVDRALTMRAKRMEHSIREQYKRDIEDASKLAAKAFLNKNFRRVIEIFLPYERDLSAADKKKFKIARTKLKIYR